MPGPDVLCGICKYPYSKHLEAWGKAGPSYVNNCARGVGDSVTTCQMCDMGRQSCPPPHLFQGPSTMGPSTMGPSEGWLRFLLMLNERTTGTEEVLDLRVDLPGGQAEIRVPADEIRSWLTMVDRLQPEFREVYLSEQLLIAWGQYSAQDRVPSPAPPTPLEEGAQILVDVKKLEGQTVRVVRVIVYEAPWEAMKTQLGQSKPLGVFGQWSAGRMTIHQGPFQVWRNGAWEAP